jgi:hypothetical protein
VAKLIKAGGETLWSEIHKPINSIWNEKELPEHWMQPVNVPVQRKDNKTDS